MNQNCDSQSGLTSFGPLTPDEAPQGYGFSLSRFFSRAVRGATGLSRSTNSNDQPDISGNGSSKDSDKKSVVSPESRSEGCSSLLEKGDGDEGNAGSEASSSMLGRTAGQGPVPSSGHDRTLPNVLTRIRNILDNRGSTPQQYKDSDFKQYWLPDSVSRECYECEEKFTTFRRRHHCRVCGQIFCSRCCNSMIPGKIIGYTGELRVCTFCCKVVLSYLQSSNLAAEVMADLRVLQDELLPPLPSQPTSSGRQDPTYSSSGPNTPLATPRGTLRRRASLGFQEEKYAIRTRYASGDHPFGSARDGDKMTAERQLLLRDSQQLHSLWSQMIGPSGGLPLASHRHRLKSFNSCFIGRDLVQWLLVNDKASSRASAVAIGQALLEAGYILCISQLEQVFVDDYVLYRPLGEASSNPERTVHDGLATLQEGGHEPLWVKQLSSMVEENVRGPDTPQNGNVYREPGFSVDTPTSITSSTSNYCLDLNLKDNVVSIRNPYSSASQQSSIEADTIDSIVYGAGIPGEAPFSTTVSAALSASANLERHFRNQYLNSPEIMSGPYLGMGVEVLQAIQSHDASHPQARSVQEQGTVTLTNEESLIKQRLNAMWGSHETSLLCQLLDSGGLSSSWAEIILPIVHTVTDIIRPDVKNDSDDMDIRQYVQFKKVPGGNRSECQIVNGAVCTKNVADKSMKVRLTDPQILLIASTIDYQRGTDNKLLALDNLILQEANYLQNVVAKILSYKPDIILVEKSIAFLARKYLQDQGITLVMNVKPSVMERVARCAQAELVSSIDAQLTRPTLGMCHNFYLRSYSMPGPTKTKTKTLMFFDGCATHLGCTVILRGATNSELKRVKRIMYFMIYAVYNWKLERSFLVDEFTMIAPLPSESFDLEEAVSDSDNTSIKKSEKILTESPNVIDSQAAAGIKTSEANRKESVDRTQCLDAAVSKLPESEQSAKVLVSTSSEVEIPSKEKVYQTVSDFSDPLHSYLESGASPLEGPLELSQSRLPVAEVSTLSFKKVLDETVLSCTPYLKYSVPHLESEVGRNCSLRRFFQKVLYFSVLLEPDYVMKRLRFAEMEPKEVKDENQNVEIKAAHKFTKVKSALDANDRDFKGMLADFRARGGQTRNVCKCEKSPPKAKLKVHSSNGQGILEASMDSARSSSSSKPVNEGSLWSGQSCMMLTPDGRFDALHPFNHQRLSVLFSSYSHESELPIFCVDPRVLTMDFYGRNDIPLGAFLERYCFSPTYTCPSAQCHSVAVVDHIRKFVHDTGCIDVILRRLDTPLDDSNSGSILMWSWCRHCQQVSPVRSMSLETWSLSFAKYLELRFHGGSLTRRGATGCQHSLHHDHFQYFGYKNQVAVFKYYTITPRELVLPPAEMKLCLPHVTQSSVVELIKGVAMQGYSVFSTILEKVTSLLSDCGSRWEPLIVEISEHQNKQRSVFRGKIESIQLQLTSPTLEARRLHPPTPGTTQELSSTMLGITDQVTIIKRLIAQVVLDWNSKVQDLVQLRKKEEKLEKAKALGPGGGLPRQSTSTSISTSSAASVHATSSTGEMFSAQSQKQGGDTASVASSAALTGVSNESLSLSASSCDLPGQEQPRATGADGEDVVDDGPEATSSPQSRDAQNKLGIVFVTPTTECLMEERDRLLQSLTALTSTTRLLPKPGTSVVSLSSASSEMVPGSDPEVDVAGGLHAVMTPQLSEIAGSHRRQASDSCEGLVGSHSPTSESAGRSHERSLSDGGATSTPRDNVDRVAERKLISVTPSVKSIISTFWSSSANLLVESPFAINEHYLLLPEVSIPVAVYGEEPSSIIAHALASQEYQTELVALKKRLKDLQKEGPLPRSSDKESWPPSEGSNDNSSSEDSDFHISTSEKNKPNEGMHIEIQWHDQNASFYCKMFFPEHFRLLRKMIFPYGEEMYIRSLSRCVQWEARGGKSGSVFCKSQDDRFVLKEMSRFEMSSFLVFGPAYTQYIMNCEKEQQPTILTRIVGVYRICYKNSVSDTAKRMDLLVMENLFYQRNITHKFDLKGSHRNRLVKTLGKEESDLVLLDENLLRMACTSPLYVRPHSKTVLNRAIAADTVFLSQLLIMDYSLLVGIDSAANELVIGIIDYIRTFTWDKKLETIIKGSMLVGPKNLPTVVSPEIYRTRFRDAMERYFLLTPDRWTGLGLGIEP